MRRDRCAPEAERALLCRDGIQVDPVTLVGALNGPLDLSAATGFALGNRSASGLRSFEGELFYGAVYAAALTPERVAAHAQRLLISDDTDPR